MGFSNKKKNLHRELIGWLWFAIGRSHVSDRLSLSRASKCVIRARRDNAARGKERRLWTEINEFIRSLLVVQNRTAHLNEVSIQHLKQ